MKKSIKELSRLNLAVNEGPNIDQSTVRTGCLMRIADAAEVISKRYTGLMSERDWYKQQYECEKKRAEKAEARIRAYKGQITKLKDAAQKDRDSEKAQ